MKFAIEGEFNDIHPYMDYLFLLSQDYELRVVDWASWVARIADELNDWDLASFVSAALSDNRKLSTTKGADRVRETRNLGRVPEDLVLYRAPLGVHSCADWVIYNRTLYYATSNGVWMLPLLINGTFDGTLEPRKLIEPRSFQLRAKFGLITAACGVEGLAASGTYVWDFQELPHVEGRTVNNVPADRIGWMQHNVIGISEDSASLLYNSLADADFGSGYTPQSERQAVSQFGFQLRSSRDLFAEPTHFVRGFASNQRLYGWAGNRVKIMAFDAPALTGRLGVVKEFELPVTSIYEGTSFQSGLTFDTDQGTYFTSALHIQPTLISRGENVIVRTFTQSKQYNLQVWSVKEDHLEIEAF
ncbi:MAG TPA: hypothetical protein VJB57_21300 [Dehalococcoidia bacterium]|nr:hypothetical protein [Dehalococcoidia bacterium]